MLSLGLEWKAGVGGQILLSSSPYLYRPGIWKAKELITVVSCAHPPRAALMRGDTASPQRKP